VIDWLRDYWLVIIPIIFFILKSIFGAAIGRVFVSLYDSYIQKWLVQPIQKRFEAIKLRFFDDGERELVQSEIENLITSAIPRLDKNDLVFCIINQKAITISNKEHYTLDNGNIHLERRFKFSLLLKGDESYFYYACQEIGTLIVSYEKKLHSILYLERKGNQLFASKICDKKSVTVKPLLRANEKIFYRERDSLQGQNVIIADLLLCSKDILQKAIDYIIEQGGDVLCVVIMFSCWPEVMEFKQKNIKILTAYRIDLKMSPKSECTVCKKVKDTKPLTYDNEL
jgi:hypothetical protein